MFLNLPGLHVLIQNSTYLQNVFPQWQKLNEWMLQWQIPLSLRSPLLTMDASKTCLFYKCHILCIVALKTHNLHTNFIFSKYEHSFFTVKNENKMLISKKIGKVLLRCIQKPRLTERKDWNEQTSQHTDAKKDYVSIWLPCLLFSELKKLAVKCKLMRHFTRTLAPILVLKGNYRSGEEQKYYSHWEPLFECHL